MEVFESCLDYLVTILFGMIERVVPKWCLSHSGTCKIYLWVKKIPATELSLREGEIPATDFGSMLFRREASRLWSYVVGVAVMVEPAIGCWLARVAIRVRTRSTLRFERYCGQASIFQETLRRVVVRVGPAISCWLARVAIRVRTRCQLSSEWSLGRASIFQETPRGVTDRLLMLHIYRHIFIFIV